MTTLIKLQTIISVTPDSLFMELYLERQMEFLSCFSSVFVCILNIEWCSLKKEEQDQTKLQNNLALISWIVAHLHKDEAQEGNMKRGENP